MIHYAALLLALFQHCFAPPTCQTFHPGSVLQGQKLTLTIERPLGFGGCGQVYVAVDGDGTKYALKTSLNQNDFQKEMLKVEIDNNREINSWNIPPEKNFLLTTVDVYDERLVPVSKSDPTPTQQVPDTKEEILEFYAEHGCDKNKLYGYSFLQNFQDSENKDAGESMPLLYHDFYLHSLPQLAPSDHFDLSVSWMALPYFPLGDLDQFRRKTVLNGVGLQTAALQILQGLLELHKREYIFYDLKPANIIVSGHNNASGETLVKIIDFGFMRKQGNDPDSLFWGTIDTLAPEVYLYRGVFPLTTKVDMWSFGVTLHYMKTGKYLFKDQPNLEGKSHQSSLISRIKDAAYRQLNARRPDLFEGYKPTSQVTIEQEIGCPGDQQDYILNCYVDGIAEDCYCELMLNIFYFDPSIRLTAEKAIDAGFFKTGWSNIIDSDTDKKRPALSPNLTDSFTIPPPQKKAHFQ